MKIDAGMVSAGLVLGERSSSGSESVCGHDAGYGVGWWCLLGLALILITSNGGGAAGRDPRLSWAAGGDHIRLTGWRV